MVVARLADLLPDLRQAVESARTPAGWDPARLRTAVAASFDFLGPYVDAAVLFGREAPRVPGLALADDEEVLVTRFTPPTGRDIVGAERTFQRATRIAESGDARRALPDLERVVRTVPEVAKYHRALGQAHLVLGRLEDAEDEFLRALRLDPQDADALTLLGNLYAHRSRHGDAIPLYERSLALGRNVYALNNLAAAVARLGRRDEAVALFREAIAEDPSYANAHYGLALTLAQAQDPALLPEALDELEAALTALGTSSRDPAVWHAAQRLLQDLSVVAAGEQAAAAAAAVREVLVERETESVGGGDAAIPVRVEQARLEGVLAKIEMAWVHGRRYHRLLVGEQAGPEREHLVLHELEHLRLIEAARAKGTNRWFGDGPAGRQKAMRALQADVDRMAKKGVGAHDAAAFVESARSGLLGQLFNFPIDLWIETRLLERLPRVRELLYQSLRRQLDQSIQIAENPRLQQLTPAKIFRANTAMNAAMALWLDAAFPRRSDLVDRFRKTEAFPLGRRLYQHWTAAAPTWTPGAEYGWIDAWADLLGLRDWYTWQDGNPAGDAPESAEPRAGEGGNRTSGLEPAQEMGATFFMLGALEWAADRSKKEVATMAARAAMIGQNGIRYQDPDSRYSLPGFVDAPISGLQLLSVMYVLVKMVAPDADQGIDLEGPYAAARQLFEGKHGRRPDESGDADDDEGERAPWER